MFASEREGTDGFDLFVKNLIENSPPERLLTLPGAQFPTDWPSDDTIVFENGPGSRDLWLLDMSSDSALATEYLPSEDVLLDMRTSSTGDLAAYVSNEGGTQEVYVRSFPEAGAREQVSQGGGQNPVWAPDGNTIYYWTLGPPGSVRLLIAARVQRGPPFVVQARDTILEGQYRPSTSDLHPDGDRIITTTTQGLNVTATDPTDDESGVERFLVVTNWFEELRERMGGN